MSEVYRDCSLWLASDGRPPSIDDLRAAFERRKKITHWGEPRVVTPRVVNKVFGDGHRLIWLAPLNTRPNYYILRVDSTWGLNDELRGHLDRIYRSIARQFGKYIDPDKPNHWKPKDKGFPVLDLTYGTCWGQEAWPRKTTKSKAAIT